ncbi:MAG: DMT family transporter [Peptococcaceae bacterium]|nr:DMT family transporter [Peptococcaceae bacterium]
MAHTRQHLFVFLGVMFISFSSIFIRMAEAPSLIIAFYRLLFTVLLLLPLFLREGISELKTLNRNLIVLSTMSGVFLALHFYAFMASLKYTSVTSSTVLVTIHPIFVGLGSFYFLKEKMSSGFVKAVFITLIGGIVISISDAGQGNSALFGDVLAFLGALLMTLYMLIGRVARQKISVTTYTFWVYLSSTITLFVINLIVKKPFYPYAMKEWILFLAMAFVCTVLGHNVLNWALKFLNPTFISTAILGEPVFATFWAMLFFSEFPGMFQLIGSSIVIFGLLMLIKKTEQPKI